MKITGIAQPTQTWYDRTNLPSGDMVFLAMRALRTYRATGLITSLTPGWDQALVKAAIELDLPYTVAVPYPGFDQSWDRVARISSSSLLARAYRVVNVMDCEGSEAWMETHCWRVDQADLVLALWDYRFSGETYQVMSYALNTGKQVTNLWQDWEHLASLKRRPAGSMQGRRATGAQVYESKK